MERLMKTARRIALGALLMYLFDPDNGRGRRARLLDQIGAQERRIQRRATGLRKHVRNRAKGARHELEVTIDRIAHPMAAMNGDQRRAAAWR